MTTSLFLYKTITLHSNSPSTKVIKKLSKINLSYIPLSPPFYPKYNSYSLNYSLISSNRPILHVFDPQINQICSPCPFFFTFFPQPYPSPHETPNLTFHHRDVGVCVVVSSGVVVSVCVRIGDVCQKMICVCVSEICDVCVCVTELIRVC